MSQHAGRPLAQAWKTPQSEGKRRPIQHLVARGRSTSPLRSSAASLASDSACTRTPLSVTRSILHNPLSTAHPAQYCTPRSVLHTVYLSVSRSYETPCTSQDAVPRVVWYEKQSRTPHCVLTPPSRAPLSQHKYPTPCSPHRVLMPHTVSAVPCAAPSGTPTHVPSPERTTQWQSRTPQRGRERESDRAKELEREGERQEERERGREGGREREATAAKTSRGAPPWPRARGTLLLPRQPGPRSLCSCSRLLLAAAAAAAASPHAPPRARHGLAQGPEQPTQGRKEGPWGSACCGPGCG
eukprot:3852945-Rhodomonas_salina.3